MILIVCCLSIRNKDKSNHKYHQQIYNYLQMSTAKNMVITWGPDCGFIFLDWTTTQYSDFWLGVAITFITCFLTTAYGPIIRKHIKNESKTRLGLTFGYLIEYLLKLYVMLLMMTMNVYVCIAIALGISSGYTVFGIWGDKIRKKIFVKNDSS